MKSSEDILPDARVVKFIKKHHVMTIATINSCGLPETANLFYVYDVVNAEFVFTTSLSTSHGSNMLVRPNVAANIVLETMKVGIIEGLQLKGEVRQAIGDEHTRAKKQYLKKYPFAIVADLQLWILRINDLKYTDNKLGFGKKILWTRNQIVLEN